MKISIIIPVYNAEKFLRECIESALNQTYTDLEIIAVNDGSTDNSLHILLEYEKKITIIDKKNGGTASALNQGIKKMSGEWFKWLSADDVLETNGVEELVNLIKDIGDKSNNFILYGNQNFINSEGKIIGEYIEPNHNSLTNFEQGVVLLNQHFGSAVTSLIHKSVFQKCGLFNETFGYYEDYEFWLRAVLLFDYRLYYVPKKIMRYRIHSQSISSTKLVYRFEKLKEIRSHILSQLPDEKRKKFQLELKMYQKNLPLGVKIRHRIRDFIIKYFPKAVFNISLKIYIKIKNRFVVSN